MATKEKLLPNTYVVANITERARLVKKDIKAGMFLYVHYKKNTTNNKPPIIVQRVVFVLNPRQFDKMHCIDLSVLTKAEFKRFYASYLAEDDPERFAELLSKDLPTVVEDITPSRPFYKGTLKIPLGKFKISPYRTYFYNKIQSLQRIYYRTGNNHPLVSDEEIKQILSENNVRGYDS